MSIGQIVYSMAGRDAGKMFVVIAIADKDYVFIADGRLRRVEKAKKKKVKHIRETEFIDAIIKDKLNNGLKVTNAEVRKTIAGYLQIEGKEEGISFV